MVAMANAHNLSNAHNKHHRPTSKGPPPLPTHAQTHTPTETKAAPPPIPNRPLSQAMSQAGKGSIIDYKRRNGGVPVDASLEPVLFYDHIPSLPDAVPGLSGLLPDDEEFPRVSVPGEQRLSELSNDVFVMHGDKVLPGRLTLTTYRLYFEFSPGLCMNGARTCINLALGAVLQVISAKYKPSSSSSSSSKATTVPSQTRATHAASVEGYNITSIKDDSTISATVSVYCKDMQRYRLGFVDSAVAKNLTSLLTSFAFPVKLDYLYSFAYKQTAVFKQALEDNPRVDGWKVYDPEKDFARMGLPGILFEYKHDNADFKLSPTYPPLFLWPKGLNQRFLKEVCSFRSKARIPCLIWKHPKQANMLWRCAQPLPGMQKKRNTEDEQLCYVIGQLSGENKQLSIFDARPYANALGNVALGKGFENTDCYNNCTITFCNIKNIHEMRKSYNKMLSACLSKNLEKDDHFFKGVHDSSWLHHASDVLKATNDMVLTIDRDGGSVLSHCSDGWDRTSQLCALTELCLDAHYRTCEGFMALIEKEWLGFGHKFQDRVGHGDSHAQSEERSPIFIQFLDVVYQLTRPFPFHFQFNEAFLLTIADHLYSCRFGTFLCNNARERAEIKLQERTVSLWTYMLAGGRGVRNEHLNPLFDPSGCGQSPQHTHLLPPSSEFDSPSRRSSITSRTSAVSVCEEDEEGSSDFHFGAVLYPSWSLQDLCVWRGYWCRYANHQSLTEGRVVKRKKKKIKKKQARFVPDLEGKDSSDKGTVPPYGAACAFHPKETDNVYQDMMLMLLEENKQLKEKLEQYTSESFSRSPSYSFSSAAAATEGVEKKKQDIPEPKPKGPPPTIEMTPRTADQAVSKKKTEPSEESEIIGDVLLP
jgi:hypothetical protein